MRRDRVGLRPSFVWPGVLAPSQQLGSDEDFERPERIACRAHGVLSDQGEHVAQRHGRADHFEQPPHEGRPGGVAQTRTPRVDRHEPVVEALAPKGEGRVAGLGRLEPRDEQRRQLETEGKLDVRGRLSRIETELAGLPLEQIDEPIAALGRESLGRFRATPRGRGL
jgi:hypothetical protein